MSLPLVSVIMTVFNRADFLAQAIESVLASDYENFELLIVDDYSTDDSFSIAQKYAALDGRIRTERNSKNLGDYHNRNHAATLVKGKYIKYVDSDDLIYPHGLGVMVRAMEKYPNSALGIISGNNQEEQPFPYELSSHEAYIRNFYKQGIFNTGPTGLIFRTENFRQVGGFTGKRFIGDTEINLRMAARWPVTIIGSSLVFWRIHAGQEFTIGLTGTGYLELSLPMLEAELAKPECPLSPDQVSDILQYYRKIAARKILRLAIINRQFQHSFKLAKKLSIGGNDFFKAIVVPDKKINLSK